MTTTYSSTQFDKAVAIIASPGEGAKPTQADQLIFYGLFKQANEGDNTKPKPGMMDFAGKAKWAAWNEVKGLSTEEAKSNYVAAFLAFLERNAGESSDANKALVLAA